MIAVEQIKAARAMLDWSQADLAERAGVSRSTLNAIEKGKSAPLPTNLEAIEAALISADVVLLAAKGKDGPGVRLSRHVPVIKAKQPPAPKPEPKPVQKAEPQQQPDDTEPENPDDQEVSIFDDGIFGNSILQL